MKATAVTELPKGDEWIYEVKWDGYRALGLKHGDSVRLLSLKDKDLTTDFPAVAEALRSIRATTATIDGEIVAVIQKAVRLSKRCRTEHRSGRTGRLSITLSIC